MFPRLAPIAAMLSSIGFQSYANELRIDLEDLFSGYRAKYNIELDVEFVDRDFLNNAFETIGTDPASSNARLLEAFETTYAGSELRTFGSHPDSINIQYLVKDGDIILVRLFWNTISRSTKDPADEIALIEAIIGERFIEDPSQVVDEIWQSYLDPQKREYPHGFVRLTEIENQVMAWGVPPDFIEVVLTTRPDCEFLPVRLWLSRQLCP